MRCVYGRWLISAATWNCCQVGCQVMDCLWMACFVCPRAGHFPDGLYGLTFLSFWLMCVSCGLVKPHIRGLFFSLKMCMKSLSAFELVCRLFVEES